VSCSAWHFVTWSGGAIGRAFLVALPAIAFVVRAAVIEGVATATEVSTIGIAYAIVAGLLIYRRFDVRRRCPMLVETAAFSHVRRPRGRCSRPAKSCNCRRTMNWFWSRDALRAKKARYYEDWQLRERLLPPPKPKRDAVGHRPNDDWSRRPLPAGAPKPNEQAQGNRNEPVDDPANGGIRREPELPEHEEVAPERAAPAPEFAFSDEEPDDEVQRARILRQQATSVARQAAMDPGDGIDL